MPDREVVIRSLINCSSDEYECSDKCQYFGYANCVYSLMRDAAQLLKAQEPVKPVNVYMYRKMYSNVKSGYCPICNNEVEEGADNNFCCKCGRRLNWDD